jgi:hypothetical protein
LKTLIRIRLNPFDAGLPQASEEKKVGFDCLSAGFSDLHNRLNLIENGLNERDGKLNKRIDSLDEKLENIAEALGAKRTKTNKDDEDRKRLKERLMQAIDHHHDRFPESEVEKESWISYIFGICESNGRTGKQGSKYGFFIFEECSYSVHKSLEEFLTQPRCRLIHPRSRFMQGQKIHGCKIFFLEIPSICVVIFLVNRINGWIHVVPHSDACSQRVLPSLYGGDRPSTDLYVDL